MGGIVGLLPGRQMALRVPAIGGGNRQIVVVVDVAEGASHIRVSIGEQESSRAVIELGVQPIVKRMAARAVRGGKCSSGRWMDWVRRLLPIRQVARRTGRRKPQVISDRGVFMALPTFHYSVRTKQRKAIEMLLNRLDRYLPAEDRVALGAVRAELSAVNVGVAIGAVLTNIGENWFGMASGAGYLFMHAAKRVPRGVVVEFGNGANGGPACVRVAIFAGSGEGAVRTPARLPLGDCRHDKG